MRIALCYAVVQYHYSGFVPKYCTFSLPFHKTFDTLYLQSDIYKLIFFTLKVKTVYLVRFGNLDLLPIELDNLRLIHHRPGQGCHAMHVGVSPGLFHLVCRISIIRYEIKKLSKLSVCLKKLSLAWLHFVSLYSLILNY